MRKTTLSEYVAEALSLARYEFCGEIGQWCAYIDKLPGVWAQGDTVEEVRAELAEVIEGWLILALQRDERIPAINGATVGRLRRGAKYAPAQTG